MARGKESLAAHRRSLAAWINNTLGATVIDADNLMSKLSTGVILCQLARRIQEQVDDSLGEHPVGRSAAAAPMKFWNRARRETFFARDNAALFIGWCRKLGVREAALFESDGLVLQTREWTVILCLLEVARIAAGYGVLPPPPEGEEGGSSVFEAPRCCCRDSGCSSGTSSPTLRRRKEPPRSVSGVGRETISSRLRTLSRSHSSIVSSLGRRGEERKQRSPLDRRVSEIAGQYLKEKDRIQRLSEGHYTFLDKNVFLRMVRRQNVVVRIGGGWDTLGHFLSNLTGGKTVLQGVKEQRLKRTPFTSVGY